MPRKSSREAILNAAEEVVLEVGAAHMALDAVAKKAGISKGGLIYNFPTKEALLHAMVTRLIERSEAARARERAKLPEGPAREIKAHVLSLLNPSPKDERVSAALLAAAAHDPQLVAPSRDARKAIFDEFAASGLTPERTAVIMLATDGLWLTELLGASPFNRRQRKGIIAELLRLADK